MEVLCDATIEGNTSLVKQILPGVALSGGKLHPQYGARALVLAVREHKTGFLRDLLFHSEVSSYDILDPGFRGLEDIDIKHMLCTRESPFKNAIKTNWRDTIELPR
jgi:hypothetical protein